MVQLPQISYTDIIIWSAGAAGTVISSVGAIMWMLVKKIMANEKQKLVDAFASIEKQQKAMDALISNQVKYSSQIKADMNSRFDKIVSDFERKSENMVSAMHKLDISMSVSQDRLNSIVDMQKELKETTSLTVKLDATLTALQKTVENFGKVILKP